MPNYAYRCMKCNAEWEANRRVDERDDPIDCPECGWGGKRFFSTPPTIPWYPDCTKSPYKK